MQDLHDEPFNKFFYDNSQTDNPICIYFGCLSQ